MPFLFLQKVEEKLKTLERHNFGKDNLIRVVIVGCGYSGVELAATISERLQEKGVVQAINVETTICPTAPPGNREAATKVRNSSLVDLGSWICIIRRWNRLVYITCSFCFMELSTGLCKMDRSN